MTIHIHEVDKQDETALRAWWQAAHDGSTADRALDTYPVWEMSRVALPRENPEWEVNLFAAYDDEGRVVGTSMMNLPISENLQTVFGDISVPADHRNGGVGAALLTDLERRALEIGRPRVIMTVTSPPDGVGPGERFAVAHGYTLANREGFKVVELAASEPRWAALEEQVAERIGDYRIVEWGNRTPDEHMKGLCSALSRFMTMVPLGELVIEDSDWTPERIRAAEARSDDIGRQSFCAAAISPAGELVGYTEVRISVQQSSHASIGITMVLAGHRGHSLGLAMKLATHRSLRAAYPACEFVETTNAEANPHMNSVNEKLGYRLVEVSIDIQKDL